MLAGLLVLLIRLLLTLFARARLILRFAVMSERLPVRLLVLTRLLSALYLMILCGLPLVALVLLFVLGLVALLLLSLKQLCKRAGLGQRFATVEILIR